MAADPLEPVWSLRLDEAVDAVAWHGTTMAAMPAVGALLIAAGDGSGQTDLPGHGGGNQAMAWSPDGTVLASGGQDGAVALHRRTGGAPRRCALGRDWIGDLAWNADGRLAVAAGRSVVVLGADGAVADRHDGFPSTVAGVAWSPDGRMLAASHYGGITVIDADGRRAAAWKGSQLRLAFSHDGRWLAAATQDRAVHLWRMGADGHCEMSGFPEKVHAFAWGRNRLRLACAGGAHVAIWDCSGAGPEGRAPAMFAWHRAVVAALDWHPQRHLLASADADGWLAVWSPGERGPATCWQAAAGLTCARWDDAGRLLAVGDRDGGLAVIRR